MVDGHCVRTIHAETNAIIQAALHGVSTRGCTCYVTHFLPELRCAGQCRHLSSGLVWLTARSHLLGFSPARI